MDKVLVTHHMSKQYAGKHVITNVDLNVKKGEIYGLLGPNGAGKTTIMRMIAGLIEPSSGTIELFGEQLTSTSFELRKRIGSLIEYPIFYEHLSAAENIALHAEYMGYYHQPTMDRALELTGLTEEKEKPVKHFSLGMKQRLGIARAICTRPQLLILDEPINGLDPVGIRQLRELFQRLSREYGMTILVSSHILQEMEHLADTIAVIRSGQLLKEVSMEHIRTQQKEYMEVVVTNTKQAATVLETKMNVVNFKVIDQQTIRIYEATVSPVELAKNLVLNDVGIESLSRNNASLEDYFLEIIQGGGFDA